MRSWLSAPNGSQSNSRVSELTHQLVYLGIRSTSVIA
jgi:hypothetical protein